MTWWGSTHTPLCRMMLQENTLRASSRSNSAVVLMSLRYKCTKILREIKIMTNDEQSSWTYKSFFSLSKSLDAFFPTENGPEQRRGGHHRGVHRVMQKGTAERGNRKGTDQHFGKYAYQYLHSCEELGERIDITFILSYFFTFSSKAIFMVCNSM